MSVGAWLLSPVGTSILTKYNDASTSQREWRFQYGSSAVSLFCIDHSEAKYISRASGTFTTTAPTFVVATYDGSEAGTGMNLYINGVVNNGAVTDEVGYVSMENTAGLPTLFARQEPDNLYTGSMFGGPFGPFYLQAALTAEQIYNIYAYEAALLGM